MPLTGEAKRAWDREYQRKKRARVRAVRKELDKMLVSVFGRRRLRQLMQGP